MITTKTCSTCEHFPNDHHCVGCLWDENKRENTKWELKKNPIVIERVVLDKIRAEIVEWRKEPARYIPNYDAYKRFLELIDKYR